MQLLKKLGAWLPLNRKPRRGDHGVAWRYPGGWGASGYGVHGADRFGLILRRERDRADRNSQGLVLLSLELDPGQAGDEGCIDLLCDLLLERLRSTDEVGWLDENRLGVVLPNTPAPGGWKLAEDLRVELADLDPTPRFTVYSYPRDEDDELGEREEREDEDKVAATPIERRNLALVGRREERQPELMPRAEPMEGLYLRDLPFSKRLLDIAVSSICLVLFSPIMAAAGLAIILGSPGPIIFRQTRVTRGGRHFTFYKFRTMYVDAEARKQELMARNEQEGPVFKITNDPRITPVGHILRRTSIDELPQLWNVLKGDMTLVGPRPPLPDEVSQYDAWQRRRLDVTGGLTCIWQVSGRSDIPFTDWMRLDLDYVSRSSPALDLKILLQTLPAVVSTRGAK